MQIAVDFVQGTNGAYLEYIGNTFVVPTVDFHSPFDELNRSHNKQWAEDSVFACGHYYIVGLPATCTHVIWIDIDADDLNRLRAMKMAKFNSADDVHAHSGILDRPAYVDDNYVFRFKWSKMFATNTFLSELERMCKFLGVEFAPTGQLVGIHNEFLARHHFLLDK